MVSIEEIKDLMGVLYTKKELEEVGIEEYTDKDIMVYEERATILMRDERWSGRYVENRQETIFPRVIEGEEVETPLDIKKAAVILIIEQIKEDEGKGNERYKLQKQGVKSIKAAGIEEVYIDREGDGIPSIKERDKRYTNYIKRYVIKNKV